jgi:hypothetical protein
MRFNTPQAGNGGMNWNFPSWAFLATGGDRGQGWPVGDGVAFKATAILDLADRIVSDLNRSKRHAVDPERPQHRRAHERADQLASTHHRESERNAAETAGTSRQFQ